MRRWRSTSRASTTSRSPLRTVSRDPREGLRARASVRFAIAHQFRNIAHPAGPPRRSRSDNSLQRFSILPLPPDIVFPRGNCPGKLFSHQQDAVPLFFPCGIVPLNERGALCWLVLSADARFPSCCCRCQATSLQRQGRPDGRSPPRARGTAIRHANQGQIQVKLYAEVPDARIALIRISEGREDCNVLAYSDTLFTRKLCESLHKYA